MTDLQMRYKPTLFTPSQDSPFTGEPTREGDRAWHDLMENMTIRVSLDELKAGDQTSVALPEGGYMAWLGVFHELHCVVSNIGQPVRCRRLCTSLTIIAENAAGMEVQRLLSS
jgi:Mycotoxin biosynthesis protein UstYa